MGENKDYIVHPDENGNINISQDVIAVIAASSALEVEGVACLSAVQGKEIADYLSKKSLSKGVRISEEDQRLVVDLYLMVKLGFAVNEVGQTVQSKVLTAIEAATGLSVAAVNVHVTGVVLDKQK